MWNSGRERVLRRDEWDHPSYPLSLYCGWIIGGESCNYYKHRICMWKRKIHNDPLHPDSKRLIEFCFFVKRNENEDRGQVGRTGSGEKEKRGGTFPLWENHPQSVPNWPRGDEALRLWESRVAFNQRSLFFQEAGAPAALRSLSRCWELHALYFILLIKRMLQERKVNFTQMFQLNIIDEPKCSGVKKRNTLFKV